MAFKKKLELSADTTITLGGVDKDGKNCPKSVEGYYLGSRATPDKGFGPGTLHFFQTATGNVGVWGKSRLNSLLTKDLIGTMVRPTFTGMSPKVKGRNPSYLFDLEVDEANTIDVSGLDTNPTTYQDDDDSDYQSDDVADEADVDADDAPADEVPPARAAAPRRPVTTPSAESQARTQALLRQRRA